MTPKDEIVRKLKRQGVEVHDSRGQARSASASAGGAAAVSFLGGAVLGGIITAMLANRDSGNESEGDR